MLSNEKSPLAPAGAILRLIKRKRQDRRGRVPAIMLGQPNGVAHGDEQDRNHAAAIAPFGRAVERNERSECGKPLLKRID